MKIKRTFVSREAYLKIRDWILQGTLQPGAKLKDQELALRMGVSRTPVREALLKLEDEGFVVTKPNRSTQVSSIDFQSAFPLYSIVCTLEKLALSQAFGHIKEEQIQQMREANERFLVAMKINRRIEALQADTDFHAVYIELSQNRELEKIVSDLKFKLKRLDLYYFEKIKNALLSYEEHKAIIQALEEGDLAKVLQAVEANWKNSFARFSYV